ncbi:MAG TPA: hypothetical protein VGC82_01760, partial [Rhodopila sp.]
MVDHKYVMAAPCALSLRLEKLRARLPPGVDVSWPSLARPLTTEVVGQNFGQVDKWKVCLKAATMPQIRSEHG